MRNARIAFHITNLAEMRDRSGRVAITFRSATLAVLR